MLKKSVLIVATLAMLAMTACSGLRVQSDWDPSVDFSRFQTFTILENDEPAMGPLIQGMDLRGGGRETPTSCFPAEPRPRQGARPILAGRYPT